MKTIIATLILALAACGIDLASGTVEQDVTYCNAPFLIACFPGTHDNCAAKCVNNLAECPEYDVLEIGRCRGVHGHGPCVQDLNSAAYEPCDQWSNPCWPHNCILGDPAFQ